MQKFIEIKKQEPTYMVKKYTIFTRGCFDYLHLGHFILLTSFLVEASKILVCDPREINFVLSLAEQSAEVAKNISYYDSQIERYERLESLKILDKITIDRHTMPIFDFLKNHINCFCIGSDQDSSDTFKKVIKECELLYINIIKIPTKISGISSTVIRERISKFGENKLEAKEYIESEAILDEKSRNNILTLKELNIIDDAILLYFNLDSECKTRKMKELENAKIKSPTCLHSIE